MKTNRSQTEMPSKQSILQFSLLVCLLLPWTAAAAEVALSALPCASEIELESFLKKVSFRNLKGSGACDDSDRSKVGKILKFINDQFSFSLELLTQDLRREDKRLESELTHLLSDPLGFLGSELPFELQNDCFSPKTVGYVGPKVTDPQGGLLEYDMKLCQGFFVSPIISMLTLVHEVWHIKSNVSHVVCHAGRYVLMGGCDQEFSLQKDSGAYSFELNWLIELLKRGQHLAPFLKAQIREEIDRRV